MIWEKVALADRETPGNLMCDQRGSMRLLRHARARCSVLRLFRRPATPPTYPNPEVDDGDDDALLRACETFMGARGGNADQREAYRARAMESLISDPSVPEDRKELLRAERAKLNPKPFVRP